MRLISLSLADKRAEKGSNNPAAKPTYPARAHTTKGCKPCQSSNSGGCQNPTAAVSIDDTNRAMRSAHMADV